MESCCEATKSPSCPIRNCGPCAFFAKFGPTWKVLCIICFLVGNPGHVSGQNSSEYGMNQAGWNSTQKYIKELIGKFGSNDTLNLAQLQGMIESARRGSLGMRQDSNIPSSDSGTHGSSPADHSTTQCLSAEDVYSLYGVPQNSSLGAEEFVQIAPMLLYAANQGFHCLPPANTSAPANPSTGAVWGYGFLLVTLINLCSLTGIVVLPIMQSPFYKIILIFMVALGVGSLCGSSLFFLIPEVAQPAAERGREQIIADAFDLYASDDHSDHRSYIYTALTIVGGVYLFFLTERIMKMVMFFKDKKKSRLDVNINVVPEGQSPDIFSSISHKNTPADNSKCVVPLHEAPGRLCRGRSLREEGCGDAATLEDVTVEEEEEALTSKPRNGKVHHDLGEKANGHSTQEKKDGRQPIASLAWMIIFGDGMHNFIDGLSIGAAFSQSTLAGISVSLAVICEEIPHELGDFAILLNSGMSVGRALMFNFLSACMCYLGWILGTVLGENTSSHHWVFAVAGGMFLYISLVDMLPEMNNMAQSEEGRQIGQLKLFLLQNLGMISGLGIMLILALYGHSIDFE